MNNHNPHRHLQPLHACALVLLSALAGCAQYRPAPIHPNASASVLMSRRLNQPRLLQFLHAMGAHPQGGWGLSVLTLVAVYERPDLRISVAGYDAAKASVTTARQIPNPTLSLAPTFNATQAFPSPFKIGPVVSFLVSGFGARQAGIAAARDRKAAAQALIVAGAWQEKARVRNALLTLWLDQRAARLKRHAAAYAATAAGLIAQRVTSGMLAETVLTGATVTADRAMFDAVEAESRIDADRATLAAAIGMPVAALQEAQLSFNAFSHVSLPVEEPSLVRAALVTRPSVAAAFARYRAADAALRQAIDQQFPAVRVGPGYHYDQGDNKFILSLSLPLPIFNQNQGAIAEARARRHQAAAVFDQEQARVLENIDAANAAWRGSSIAFKAAQQLAVRAKQGEQQAVQAFRAGATGRLRMIEAEQQATLAREQVLTADAQRLRALASLADALHYPIFEEKTA